MKLWMTVDNDDPNQSGFGKTRRASQAFVADNRGYPTIRDAVKDGWIGISIKIEVPDVAGKVLLSHCENK